MIRLLLALALGAGLADVAAAQAMRDFSATRQRHGDTRLAARLQFNSGSLRLAPGPAGELYRYRLRYDAERYAPRVDYDQQQRSVLLGLENVGGAGLRVSSRRQLEQDAVITLSPETLLSLEARLGAVEGDLELGGLRLADVRVVATGASRTTVRFSRLNPVRCTSASFESRATELTLVALGNARCDSVSLAGQLGTATLDLGGTWTDGAQLDVSFAMGELTLRIPRDLGVRVAMDRFLASFERDGWTARDGGWVSPGYDRAARKVDLHLAATIGAVSVEWRR